MATRTPSGPSGRDGRIYTGKTQDQSAYVLNNVRGGSGFAISTVADTPDTSERDRGKGHQGNLEFAGYTTQAIDDQTAISFVTPGTETRYSNTSARERPQMFVATPWDKLSDGVLATARQLRQYTDTPLCFVQLRKSGTGATELADDDRNQRRRWSDLEAKVRLAGRDFSMLVWMWHASDRGQGERYGENIFDPIVLGIKHQPKHDAYEHFIYDGTFEPQMVFCPMLHWGLGCTNKPLEGEHPIAVSRGRQSTMACMRGQRAELSVTAFWSFLRELLTACQSVQAKRSRTLDLVAAGTMLDHGYHGPHAESV